MCGIVGYISRRDTIRPSKQILKIMTDKIRHRGPDAEGQWCDKQVALGHRRLSIIDLDVKSNQPMFSHDGRYVLVFNGEIYNYIELRRELIRRGCQFLTNSDSEVIIESYREYGTACFNMFNGMWAFALYDRVEKKMILSRDRFGIKPLYILDRKDVCVFASEIKAILAAFPEECVINETWMYRYLSFSLNDDVDEMCAYKNIKRFPTAHYMIYDMQTQQKELHKYWEVNEEAFYEKWIRGRNPVDTFQTLFKSAVGLRLRSDVEVGACLSGGIDSSSIVGCAAKEFQKSLHTFSSIYEDEDCNEEFYVRKVNEKWNTTPHYIRPENDEGNFTEYIKDLTYYHDQPTGGASLYSGYMVMKGVHGNVKVLLDGQGADELFAGYIPYYRHHIKDLLDTGKFLDKCMAVKLLAIIKNEWPSLLDGILDTPSIVQLVGLENSIFFSDDEWVKRAKVRWDAAPFTKEFLDKVNENYQKRDIKCSSRLNTVLCNEVITHSIPAILHNEDGNAMAFSIETRLPFLDYRIVEFAIALDGNFKIKDQWTKWIIRKACKRYLPNEVLKRTNKMGFPAPFARWLREGKSKTVLKETIYQFEKRDIIPLRTIDSYYKAHVNKNLDFDRILFKIYNLELWLQMIEGGELVG